MNDKTDIRLFKSFTPFDTQSNTDDNGNILRELICLRDSFQSLNKIKNENNSIKDIFSEDGDEICSKIDGSSEKIVNESSLPINSYAFSGLEKGRFNFGICRVCEDKASGIHYGVETVRLDYLST